ncbi:Hypothetical protein A7982_07298 [Minicystis rosea]|nr:Hypothetical protein A7982_07298 [Minicystis rosea]
MVFGSLASRVGIAALFAAGMAACGGKVVVDVPGAGGAGGSSTTGGAGGCLGSSFGCLQFCGSDFFPANAECVDGTWQCPAGTVDPQTCPKIECCTNDWDCGDESFVPCVSGVCKQPEVTGCWSDAQCGGGICLDVFVCPCGSVCNQPDVPGLCQSVP